MKAVLVIVFILGGDVTSQRIEQADYDTCESTRRMMQTDWENQSGYPIARSVAWCIAKEDAPETQRQGW